MQAMNTLVRLVLVASCAAASVSAQFQIPDRANEYATDLAGLLLPADVSALQQLCDPLIKQGTPVAVLTVAKLADHGAKPEEIGAFANAAYNAWGVGHAGDDRGALIVVSRDDRKIWIAVGHAYRAYDGAFQKIVDGTIKPYLKTDNWSAGLLAGVTAIRDRVIEPEMTQHRELERTRRVASNDPLRNLMPYTPTRRVGTPVAPQSGQSSTTTVTKTTRRGWGDGFDLGCGSIVCMVIGVILLVALIRAIFGGYGHSAYPMHGPGGYGGYGGYGGWGWGGPWGGYYGGGWGSFGTGMMMGSMMNHGGYGSGYTETTTTTTDGGMSGGDAGGGFSGGDSGGGGFSSGFDGGSSSGGGAGGDF